MNQEFLIWQKTCLARVDAFLAKILYCSKPSLTGFFEGMHYASIDGGKRIRAMLTFASGAYLNVPEAELDIYASAIESVHAFSLVHDDLPAMDNDTLRRGKPTCHVAFGEGIAILVGDALFSEAFSMLSGTMTPHFNSLKRLKMLNILARKSGPAGMVSGQYLDLKSEKQQLTLEELLCLHQMKTGALIEATIELPLVYAEPAESVATTLQNFSKTIGLIFQIQDDILDVKKTSEELGKTAGKDEQSEKSTFPRLLGLDGAAQFLNEKLDKAKALLDTLPGDPHFLNLVFEYIREREY